MLRPPLMAATLHPLPKWQEMSRRPSAGRSKKPGGQAGDVFVADAVEPVAPDFVVVPQKGGQGV